MIQEDIKSAYITTLNSLHFSKNSTLYILMQIPFVCLLHMLLLQNWHNTELHISLIQQSWSHLTWTWVSLWVKEKDYWNSNLFSRLVNFLDVETMEEEKKCFYWEMLKLILIIYSTPECDEKPSTIQSLPQVFHFSICDIKTVTDICVKNTYK